jgi:hypothetical protein
LRAKLLFVVGDYPGHCKILEMMGAGARFGCTKCMTQGEHVGRMVYHDYRHLLPEGHDFLTDPAFGEPIDPPVAPEMKTKELVEKLARSVLSSGVPITGVKGHVSRHVIDTILTYSTFTGTQTRPPPSRVHLRRALSIPAAARFRYHQVTHPSPCSLIHTALRVDRYVGTLIAPCSLMCCAGTHPMTRCTVSLVKSSTW